MHCFSLVNLDPVEVTSVCHPFYWHSFAPGGFPPANALPLTAANATTTPAQSAASVPILAYMFFSSFVSVCDGLDEATRTG